MKFVDEFRNPEQSLALLHRIKATGAWSTFGMGDRKRVCVCPVRV